MKLALSTDYRLINFMYILRQDPTTTDWVVIATNRSKRPDDLEETVAEPELTTHDPGIPFYLGQESLTSSEVIRYPMIFFSFGD